MTRPVALPRWTSFAACCAVLALAASACGSDDTGDEATTTSPATTAPASASASLAGTSWNLASAMTEGSSAAAVGSASLAFDADGTTLNGSTGCNQFAGTYTQNGADLTIALGPMTLVACADPAAAAQEQAITAGMPQVASFTMGDQLVLQDASGAELLTYDPGLAGLAGTTWTATGVNNGKQGVESNAQTGLATATFGADGTISGSAGCNTYSGSYTETGDGGLTISPLATTRKACEDALMTLESQFLAAMGAVTTYSIAADQLTLRDDGGAMQATFVLAS